MSMSTTEATLEVSMLNASANNLNFSEIAIDLATRQLPLEIVTRLESLWDITNAVAGAVVSTGRIIVIKIWEFIKENPNMAIGVVIGAAIGALVNLIPFIGQLLAPLAMAIGATVGGLSGGRMDDIANGVNVSYTTFEDLISVAKKFYALLADIFNEMKGCRFYHYYLSR